jgi:hypothetical protein
MQTETQSLIITLLLCLGLIFNTLSITDLKKTVTKLNISTQCKNEF